VLLKSAGADARGFVAKVSDFGLSVRMDPTETHVSNVYQVRWLAGWLLRCCVGMCYSMIS
jgi:hypothetical protein